MVNKTRSVCQQTTASLSTKRCQFVNKIIAHKDARVCSHSERQMQWQIIICHFIVAIQSSHFVFYLCTQIRHLATPALWDHLGANWQKCNRLHIRAIDPIKQLGHDVWFGYIYNSENVLQNSKLSVHPHTSVPLICRFASSLLFQFVNKTQPVCQQTRSSLSTKPSQFVNKQ